MGSYYHHQHTPYNGGEGSGIAGPSNSNHNTNSHTSSSGGGGNPNSSAWAFTNNNTAQHAFSFSMPSSSNHQQSQYNQHNNDSHGPREQAPPPMTTDPDFDILDWHPAYQSCQRYFLDHAQHEPATQALCALINIRLPFQWLANPVTSSTPPQQQSGQQNGGANSYLPGGGFGAAPLFGRGSSQTGGLPSPQRTRTNSAQPPPVFVSLIPYIRRLVVTAFDKPPILHGLFGDDYARGILPHLDCERRNYLFAAKHGGWRSTKRQYDVGSQGEYGGECVPFMRPLDGVRLEELAGAEKAWSGWLAMEDWMVGPRAPEDERDGYGAGRGWDGDGRQYDGDGVDARQGAGEMQDGMVDGREDGSYQAH